MSEQKHTPDPADEMESGQDEILDESSAKEQEATDESGDESTKTKKKARKDRDKLQQLEAELNEMKDKYLRLFAEFDNYKKRTIREKLDLMRTAAQDTLTSLLTILDDFDRAKRIAEDPATKEHFSEGVELVYQKLYSTLRGLGLREMESTGKDFDPEEHEAVTEIPAPSEALKGKVVDTIEKGYYLHDKIIRHAKVVIGK